MQVKASQSCPMHSSSCLNHLRSNEHPSLRCNTPFAMRRGANLAGSGKNTNRFPLFGGIVEILYRRWKKKSFSNLLHHAQTEYFQTRQKQWPFLLASTCVATNHFPGRYGAHSLACSGRRTSQFIPIPTIWASSDASEVGRCRRKLLQHASMHPPEVTTHKL